MDDPARVYRLELQVAELQKKLEFLMKHVGVEWREPAMHPAEAEALALLRQGNKIGAIKAYRIHTGADLVTAKQAVEALEAKIGK
jgi:ribosomal protein L7/L12